MTSRSSTMAGDEKNKSLFQGTGDGALSVLAQMQRAGIPLSADCGGRGTCGKCTVRFRSGAPEPEEEERKKLTAQELSDGYRLACRCCPEGAFEVEYVLRDDEIAVESIRPEGMTRSGQQDEGVEAREGTGEESGRKTGRKIGEKICEESCEGESAPREKDMLAAAVDIGTTTIAAALVDTKTGAVMDTRTCVNHQRAYGADVISRIQASNEGKGEELKRLVRKDLDELISAMGEDPRSILTVIAGNSTMEHLIQGLSCQTLGVVPFTPVDISLHTTENCLYLPGISTYVGADIVAGIVTTGMDQNDDICMLIDLGTNGEMALGNKERILVASTAAGPAFEGGNISCGVAGIPGAVSRVTITNGQAQVETIGGGEPVGLCGTGVLEVMYELLKEEIVDETGLMDEEYEDEGFPVAGNICFTDRDVREVQLAKAAIHAGALTLIHEYGITCNEVSRLYLAGGFGQQIDLVKAAGIGLLPEELAAKAEAVGNSSLKGAVAAACSQDILQRFENAVRISTEVSLSDSKVFNELYIDSMYFE